MKYFIVAGERSGDLHGGNLAAALKEQSPDVQLYGWGGDKMQNSGVKILQNYESLAFMGFVEVIKNLPKILGFMALVKKQIEEIKPDAIILVDYAGFNLRLAKWAKSKGIIVFYYIAPKAWAWNEKRAHKLRQYTNLTLAIFPFEIEFFERYGVNVKYVGNPLFDEIRSFKPDVEFRNKFDGRHIIALLPGSRKQEIESMLQTMADLTMAKPEYQWVVAGISTFDKDFYTSSGGNFTLVFDKTYDLLSVASAAVVTSGTATLETALFNVPQVVVYKTSPITFAIAKLLVKIKYISLVNLVADKGVVKELIQGEYTAENTKRELEKVLKDNKNREQQLVEYKNIIKLLGKTEASSEAAKTILNFRKS
jgi:lipid-A-disaccharide synthase